MDIKPIRTEADYEAVLARIEEIWDAETGTPESDELDVLAILVEDYEERHHPIPPPDPIEAIKFRMKQMGLNRKDLEPYIGTRGRVSEVLNRKRSLSIDMIRNLSEGLGISADVLVAQYELESDKLASHSAG
jgi:HTH-type transcriptional regulator / antitoxin HigA